MKQKFIKILWLFKEYAYWKGYGTIYQYRYGDYFSRQSKGILLASDAILLVFWSVDFKSICVFSLLKRGWDTGILRFDKMEREVHTQIVQILMAWKLLT